MQETICQHCVYFNTRTHEEPCSTCIKATKENNTKPLFKEKTCNSCKKAPQRETCKDCDNHSKHEHNPNKGLIIQALDKSKFKVGSAIVYKSKVIIPNPTRHAIIKAVHDKKVDLIAVSKAGETLEYSIYITDFLTNTIEVVSVSQEGQ